MGCDHLGAPTGGMVHAGKIYTQFCFGSRLGYHVAKHDVLRVSFLFSPSRFEIAHACLKFRLLIECWRPEIASIMNTVNTWSTVRTPPPALHGGQVRYAAASHQVPVHYKACSLFRVLT